MVKKTSSTRIRRVRMSDVAQAAGVARVTVSRVISDPESVSPATRAVVQETIDRMGFVRNFNAGALASSRSHIVGAIVPRMTSDLFSAKIDGLSETLTRAGYQLLLGQSQYQPDEEERLIKAFLSRGVDAMVLTGINRPEPLRQMLRDARIPIVETWDLTDDPIDMSIGFSNRAVGRSVAEYLLGRGARRMAFFGAHENRSMQRGEGFAEAVMALTGQRVQSFLVAPPSGPQDGAASMRALIAGPERVDAIFCGGDLLALGAMYECQRLGIKVPGQIAIVGFADLPLSSHVVPALTSVQVPGRDLGMRAAELIVARLRGETPDTRVRTWDLGFSIVERETT